MIKFPEFASSVEKGLEEREEVRHGASEVGNESVRETPNVIVLWSTGAVSDNWQSSSCSKQAGTHAPGLSRVV